MKSNSKIFITLSIATLIIFSSTLLAKSPDLTSSQVDELTKYVEKLDLVQKGVYTLSQNLMFSSSDTSFSEDALHAIRNNLGSLNTELSNALSNYKDNNYLYRDVLILQNVLNYIQASLAELSIFSKETAPSEKSSTIERFYYFRLRAQQELNLFDALLT